MDSEIIDNVIKFVYNDNKTCIYILYSIKSDNFKIRNSICELGGGEFLTFNTLLHS